MKRILCIASFFVLLAIQGHSQYVLKEADKLYSQFRYADAIPLYEKAYEKKQTLHAAQRLADCYRLNNNYEQAERWYAVATALPGSRPSNRLYYAKALQSNAKFSEAKQQYQLYAQSDTVVNSALLQTWLTSADSASIWMARPSTTIITNQQSLNSPASDWGLAKSENELFFSSDRFNPEYESTRKYFLKFDKATLPDRKRFAWTGNSYQRLYTSAAGDTAARKFNAVDQRNPHWLTYHIGPATFTADGREMYFAFSPVSDKIPKGAAAQVLVRTGIYYSRQDSAGQWSAPTALPFNRMEYAATDPLLSKDGRTLYFSANFPGGAGGMDIYRSSRQADGSWASPININAVNTAGNERTPFLTDDSILYFASDGHVGMGGLDIFSFHNNSVRNLGYPVNSPQDDLNYLTTDTAGVTYFTSNRSGGLGSDDIYRAYNPPPKIEVVAAPVVTVKEPPALPAGRSWLRVNTDGTTTPVTLLKVETNQPYRLNVRYGYKEFELGQEDRPAVDQLFDFLINNPGAYIVVASYTDSRGNDAYNKKLSQQRAGSIVDYLVSKGIERNRLTPVGYGETRLLNNCGNNVPYSEAAHELNRRAEFWVVKQ